MKLQTRLVSRISWIIVVLLLSFEASGQKRFFDSLARAQYIERFPDYFFIWPVVSKRTSNFSIQNTANLSNELVYSPNTNYNVGVGFYIFEIGFQIVVALPRTNESIQEFGESNSFNLQANMVGRNWALEAFNENYKGYYVEDSTDPKADGEPKLQRRDIETWNTGINGLYFFNKGRFSMRAPFNFYERQLRSAGSPLLFSNYTIFHLKADSALYGDDSKLVYGADGAIRELSYWTVAMAPGYGYNFIANNWFLGASLAYGPALQSFNYQTELTKNSTIQLHPYLYWRVTLGYNSERLFAGLTYSSQTFEADYGDNRFTSFNSLVRLVIGYRFREVGILKKRVSEFIKPKSR